MQEVDDLIEILFHVIGFVKKHHNKVPRSVLKFYAYLNNYVSKNDFKKGKIEKLYKSCEASLLELVKERKLVFDSVQREEEWFAKMDDLVERILGSSYLNNNYIFNSKQRELLEGKWAWLEKEVLKAFENKKEFKIQPEVWGVFQGDFGIIAQQEFYEKVLKEITENVCERLKRLFISHGEPFFAELIEKLKKRGVLFFDKTFYFIGGMAYYYPKENVVRFRMDKINTGYNYITIKHELIHTAFYNLPRNLQDNLRKLLEIELAKIKEFLDTISEPYPNALDALAYERGFYLTYALSSSDELLAHLSHPSFVQFIKDLENDDLFQKGFWEKIRKKVSKKEKFKTRLFEIEDEVYGDYR